MASYGQSVTIGYYAYNTSTPGYQTGDSANHTLKLVKDGTEASPTNAASEVDSVNCPGLYSLVLTTAEAQHNLVILAGKSSTANVIIIGTQISFELLPTALTGAGNVKADALAINGVATSSVTTVSANVGTTQALTFDANNFPKVDLVDIAGVAVATGTAQLGVNVVNVGGTASQGAAGYVGIDWSKVTNPTSVLNLSGTTISNLNGNTVQTGDAFARLGAPAGLSVSADVAAVKSDTGTILTDVNTGAGAIYNRLGAPAGASVSADIAAVNAKTTNLPASPAAVGSAMTLTASYNFALGTSAMTESYAANGAAPTPVQALMAIHQMLMDFIVSGSAIAVKQLDHSTTAFTVTLNSATAPTQALRE